ncbi:hypothetical protein BpHYR1_006534 [Brachionus plicatilis]|uniref:Uncharacterized protein n=1 Tax=Brachionus plicatilis TaxID=10195 RepID=A0A3M7SFT8_BRAPC|nr:hypothetical protein BpHYR1_006534 [Brachionus plicatilis]
MIPGTIYDSTGSEKTPEHEMGLINIYNTCYKTYSLIKIRCLLGCEKVNNLNLDKALSMRQAVTELSIGGGKGMITFYIKIILSLIFANGIIFYSKSANNVQNSILLKNIRKNTAI